MSATIYLDHGATSFPKAPGVSDAVASFLEHEAGNPGRGGHRLTVASSRAIERARDLLAASVFGRGQIIAITAGSEEPGAALAAARAARDDGHRLSILAIGTAAGGPMTSADGSLLRDGGGRPVLSRTDLAALERVARGVDPAVTKFRDSGVASGSHTTPTRTASTPWVPAAMPRAVMNGSPSSGCSASQP